MPDYSRGEKRKGTGDQHVHGHEGSARPADEARYHAHIPFSLFLGASLFPSQLIGSCDRSLAGTLERHTCHLKRSIGALGPLHG